MPSQVFEDRFEIINPAIQIKRAAGLAAIGQACTAIIPVQDREMPGQLAHYKFVLVMQQAKPAGEYQGLAVSGDAMPQPAAAIIDEGHRLLLKVREEPSVP